MALRYSGIALQFGILLVLARNLSAEDYGRYMLVLSAVLPTYFLLGFGLSESFVRDASRLAERRNADAVKPLAGAVLLVSIGCALGVAIIGSLLYLSLPLSVPTSTVLAFAVAFFIANGLMFNSAQLLLGTGSETLGAFFFYPAVNISLALSAAPYVLASGEPTLTGVAATTSAAALIIAIAAVVVAFKRTRPRRPSRGDINQLARTGIRLSLARALYAAGLWLPIFIAGVLLSPAQAGYLGTASRLAVAIGAIMAAVRFAIRPAIARAFERQDRHAIKLACGKAATATLCVSIIALAVSIPMGETLISATFGSTFAPAATLLTILLIAIVIEAAAGPVDEVLKMTGQERRVVSIFFIAVPLATAALIVAAHQGVTAMAWVQVGYTFVVFAAMVVLVRRHSGIWVHPVLPTSLIRRNRSRQVSRIGGDG
ncbi:lipopolysaccharide biosynthesis protein [Mycolicibacterium frederiksbergense]|uniref:lipopolysaccharide biosynthesis protein n=1 Tax=Mycolicibacterium frederiksbergense TaxID=117567 RepID=UPI00143A6341|nr:lipopolysaccharide biosynthesis protein [Mycolicibacterium frederiksbergense]